LSFHYFPLRAWQKFHQKIKLRRTLKICVLWWGPDRQVGALWIANLVSRDLYFLEILCPRGGFFRRFFAAKKAAK